MNALGTFGTIRDNSATYAPGSYEHRVEFVAEGGITFRAHHFVRTDKGCAVDSIHLYIVHPSSWCDDYIKTIDRANPGANLSRVDLRAMHLVNVAIAAAELSGTAERAALLEME